MNLWDLIYEISLLHGNNLFNILFCWFSKKLQNPFNLISTYIKFKKGKKCKANFKFCKVLKKIDFKAFMLQVALFTAKRTTAVGTMRTLFCLCPPEADLPLVRRAHRSSLSRPAVGGTGWQSQNLIMQHSSDIRM